MLEENITLTQNPDTGASQGGWFEPEIIELTPLTPDGILWAAITLLSISIGILILLIIVKERVFFLSKSNFQSRFKIIKNRCIFDKKPEFEWSVRNGLIALFIVVFAAASGFLIYEYVKTTPLITAVSIVAIILAFASFVISIAKYY